MMFHTFKDDIYCRKRKKEILKWIFSAAFLWFLLTPQRFSSVGYTVIRQDDIVASLLCFWKANQDRLEQNRDHKDDKEVIVIPPTEKTNNYCTINITQLGQNTVSLNPSEETVDGAFSHVGIGGTWKPDQCESQIEVLIIIPYRRRENHLNAFLRTIHPFLQMQNVKYTIIVSEQSASSKFNRARLFNIGFIEAKSLYGNIPCVIFHDVDLMPLDARNIYGCTIEGPRHLSSNLKQFRFQLPYEGLFGGAIAVSTKIFEEIDGFSNSYFGWGGEDDDLTNRLSKHTIVRFEPQIARYTMLKHDKELPNPNRFELIRSGRLIKLTKGNTTQELTEKSQKMGNPNMDGLSNTRYNLLDVRKERLFTRIVADF